MALYDPKPKVVSPDFSVADVLAWARTKPADEEYDYGDPNACALCGFLADTARAASPSVSMAGWYDEALGTRPLRPYDPNIETAVLADDWTFGALVKRLEALRSTGEAGASNPPTYRIAPRCPDCNAGDLSYRVIDEDTGCSYPIDDGEHYCRHCDAVWSDEDVFPSLTDLDVKAIGDGRFQVAA